MAMEQPERQTGYGLRGGTEQIREQAHTHGMQSGQLGEGLTGQRPGLTLEDALSGEMRLTLHDLFQAAITCEWCAERCVDEGAEMAECIRLCRDVADLALQNVRFLARDSVFGPDLAESFAYAADECARECARHPHDHCQECASVLRRAATSTWEMLDSFGHRPQGQDEMPQARQSY